MPPPLRNITIYLIKDGLRREEIIKRVDNHGYRFFDLNQTRYHVYAKRLREALPDWAAFFEQHLTNDFIGESDSPGVVLLLDVDRRTYALTFGQGRHLLLPDCYEEGFGLRVVLNSVNKVRSIDKKTFDAISGQTRTQAGMNTDVDQFGFDIERDLLRAVTGTPEDDPTLGKRLSGIDALSAYVEVDLESLPDLLRRYFTKSEEIAYRERGFGFVDHMRAVTTSVLKNELNEILLQKLNGRMDDLRNRRAGAFEFELIIPEVINFTRTNGFRYSNNVKRYPIRHDISLNTFLSYKMERGPIVDMESLRRSPVYGFNGEIELTDTWSAFKCIVGDMEHNGWKYVLNDGNWYRVNQDYVAELNLFIEEQIPVYEHAFPLYNGGTEQTYNKNVANTTDGFSNFDGKLIHPVSGQKYEYCDLYTETLGFRDIIHIKHGTSSAVLSHLFSQGTVSAELCSDHDVCFNRAKEMVEDALGAAKITDPNRPAEPRTVYGIIRPRRGTLFFFSKVNLRRACRDMKRGRMKFALAEIEYDPAYLVQQVRGPNP
ncbi:MAG: TIGR04141 family sporadically distributed protein [Pyrinomonadaceae bacterium]